MLPLLLLAAPVDLTLMTAGLARTPATAGAMTAFRPPYIVDAMLERGANDVRANDVRSE